VVIDDKQAQVMKTLIFGYGNPDRQDDGVAWHILVRLARKYDLPIPLTFQDDFENSEDENIPDFLFDLQITPELAEVISGYERVCFVDAHTGNIQEDIQAIPVQSQYQKSPFTHHMTPATCLSIADSLYKKSPSTLLVSVRGYEFGFVTQLSEETEKLVQPAVDIINNWLHQA